jgi:hypothetical protein
MLGTPLSKAALRSVGGAALKTSIAFTGVDPSLQPTATKNKSGLSIILPVKQARSRDTRRVRNHFEVRIAAQRIQPKVWSFPDFPDRRLV